MKTINNKVYLVGAGPGAVDLITVRGAKLLAQADVVYYDALVDSAMLALCPQAEKIQVGKRCGKKSAAQAFINQHLISAAKRQNAQGQPNLVVRLKGGDPMIFGRADEEINALEKEGIHVEVVPGITAALAASATLKQSLTLRGVARSIAFCTFSQAELTTPSAVFPSADTMIVYMGRNGSSALAKTLIAQERFTAQTPIVLIEAISTQDERILSLTLNQLAQGMADNWFNKESPALLMIGQAMQNKSSQQLQNLQQGCS